MTGQDMSAAKKLANHYLMAGHAIAVVCAICGLGLIIVAPLDSVVYGIVLLSLGIGIDIIVAAQCTERHHIYRRGLLSRRSRVLNARKRQPAKHRVSTHR